MLWIAVIVEEAVFLLNKRLDLTWFTDWPDQRQYWARQSFIIVASEEVAIEKIIKSSANSKWFRGEQALTILKPRRELKRSLEITSNPIIKGKGEEGHLVWVPVRGKINQRDCHLKEPRMKMWRYIDKSSWSNESENQAFEE
jgi:hypothetical protein